jgi:hypothetical protein
MTAFSAPSIRRWLSVAAACGALAACDSDPVQRELVGTWQAAVSSATGAVQLRFTTLSNGQYRLEYVGAVPAAEETGYFAAADGEWRKERITGGIEEGTYEFLSDDSVLLQSATSGAVVWTRVADAALASRPTTGDLLSEGPFGPALEPSAAGFPLPGSPAAPAPVGTPGTVATPQLGSSAAVAAPQTGGLPAAPAQFGVPTGAPLFAPPPEIVTPGATATPSSALGAAQSQAVQNAISTGARAVTSLDTRALADLPAQTLNDLEGSARQAAADVVDEAAAPLTEAADEAGRKVGERIQNVTSNAASRVRGFFTRGRRERDEEAKDE